MTVEMGEVILAATDQEDTQFGVYKALEARHQFIGLLGWVESRLSSKASGSFSASEIGLLYIHSQCLLPHCWHQ